VELTRGRVEVEADGTVAVATPYAVAVVAAAGRCAVAVDDDTARIDAFAGEVRVREADAAPSSAATLVAPGTIWRAFAASLPREGLLAWLRADDAELDPAGAIAAVPDRAGLVGAARQEDPARRPLRVRLGEGAAMRFDGVDDALGFTCAIDGLPAMTVIVAALPRLDLPPQVNSTHAAVFWDETAFWGHVYVSPFRDAIAWRFGTGAIGNRQEWRRPAALGEVSVTTIVKDGTSDVLRVDGVEVQRLRGKLPHLGACAATGWLGMGRESGLDHSPGPPTAWAGDLAEVLVYGRALSDDELRCLEQRLIHRYATAR
jgi:hypothetical protein